jgi:hypothetical protein
MSLFDKINLPPSKYKVHTFTSTGNTTFAVTGSGDIEYLVIAGGGASGNGAGGGGGAGGFRTNVSGATSGGGSSAESTYGVTAQNYTITVGAGGTGNSTTNCGNSGANSSIVPASGTSIISIGGAGAGGGNAPATLLSGGSGGGSGDAPRTGGLGTAGQGYNGGTTASQIAPYPASGGGGAGGIGGGAPSSSDGGLGLASSIQTGSPIFYAGGGGGSSSGVGHSGGGNGTAYPNDGNDATANSGSGGGGAGGSTGSGATNGSGGSGIVIIRYKTSSGITATGGTISSTVVGVANQRVVENFSGTGLDIDRWHTTNNAGTNTFAMSDEADGGFKLTTGTGSSNQMGINFNDKRQFSPTGSVAIIVGKSSYTNVYTDFGFSNNNQSSNSQSAFFRFTNQYGGGKIGFLTCGAGTTEDFPTSVDLSTDWFTMKVECKSSSVEGSINGVLERTHATRIPTQKLQPIVKHQNTDTTARSCQIKYMECYNT